MGSKKLYIAMVGLPARGKSTIATRLKDNLQREGIKVRIFNNGDLRRKLTLKDTSNAQFYDSRNRDGVALREKIAGINIERARKYLGNNGQVAILDATNVSRARRETITSHLTDHPVLFIECAYDDEEILDASILKKIRLPEFGHMDVDEARESFKKRIHYYQEIYEPADEARNCVRLNSLYNRIVHEEITDSLPHYDLLRDFLVTDTVKSLFLVRHGETYFNMQNRIGGDSPLTPKGLAQGRALAAHFQPKDIPFIFCSGKKRAIQTAEPIKALQKNAAIVSLVEFDEIDSGICECMSYEEIKETKPEVYRERRRNKYHYIYPRGEGYVSMKQRVDRGIKKALYLSGYARNIMIIGHRAVNRMILSHFLYRRDEDVPYIYIPQDKYYHIVATQNKKLFRLKPYE